MVEEKKTMSIEEAEQIINTISSEEYMAKKYSDFGLVMQKIVL